MGVKILRNVNKVPELLNAIKELENASVDIGVLGDTHSQYEDGTSVLTVARVHEFGAKIKRSNGSTTTIPERSFIRGTADNKKREIDGIIISQIDRLLQLEVSPIVAYNTIGLGIVGLTQTYLTKLSDPPNSPSTIAQKKSSNPLLDTGRLRQAITHRVNT